MGRQHLKNDQCDRCKCPTKIDGVNILLPRIFRVDNDHIYSLCDECAEIMEEVATALHKAETYTLVNMIKNHGE